MKNANQNEPEIEIKIDDEERYKRAKANHNKDVYGGVSMRNMLVVIVAICGIITFSALGFAFGHDAEPKYIPYVLNKDSDGNYNFAGFVQPTSFQLTDYQVIHYLKTFIWDIRFVSPDLVVDKTDLRHAHYMVTDSGANRLIAMTDQYDILKFATGGVSVDIQFSVFNHLAEHTWVAQWWESISKDGTFVSKNLKQGTFTFTRAKAGSQEVLEQNPDQVFITDFTIQDAQQ